MKMCIPVQADGQVGHGWGRAARVAVVEVSGGHTTEWTEYPVGWDELHDAGTEGSHHARIATFIREHGIEVVVAEHMGPGMVRMMTTMGIRLALGASGDARAAVLAAAAASN